MRHDHWRDSGAGVANGNALLAGPLEWTHPQILTGATVKREIVPAPGAGLILIPSRLIVLQNFGVAYTQARWWSAWFATQNLFQANTIDTQTVGIAIDNMDDAPSYGALTAEAQFVNVNLVIGLNANPTGGAVGNLAWQWLEYFILER